MSRVHALSSFFVAAALALLATSTPAHAAAEPTTYVIVPSLGPGELVRAATIVTGSNIDHSAHAPLPAIGTAFDDDIAAAVEKAIRKVDPIGNVARARLSGGALFQNNTTDDDRTSVEALRGALSGVLKSSPRVVAVVIAPFRTEPRLRGKDGSVRAGRAKGVGFYVDWNTPTSLFEPGTSDKGFLGIFANLRLLLVDVGEARIVGEQFGSDGVVRLTTRASGADPWEAESNEQKLAALRTVTLDEIEAMLPRLLASAR